MTIARIPRVLVLSRNYPNSVTPILGLWVEGLVRHMARHCEMKVISPVPYCPPLPGLNEYSKFRSVARRREKDGVEVFHPRFLTGPGYSTYNLDSRAYYWSIRGLVDRLRQEFPFDLIHANFGYPDGVVAAKLAARYNVPFLITEHASWIPWMDSYRKVRRQAVRAAKQCSFHIAVSKFARGTIAHFTGESAKLRVIPNGLDARVFTPRKTGEKPDPNQILYVGLTRRVKGIDILLNAMRRVVVEKPAVKLVIVGGGINRSYSIQEKEFRVMAENFGLKDNVQFVGLKSPQEVARYMRESTVLVLPSRTETFGAVLIEALACGTPVVASRCGGTEDIVTEKVGKLVPKEDADALASAILEIIENRHIYNPSELSAYAVSNFAWEKIAEKTVGLYVEAVGSGHLRKAALV